MDMLTTSTRLPIVVLVLTLAAAGCEIRKSSTPLSPSLAGPIAGVEITTPQPVQPKANDRIRDSEQPITLAFTNAESNSVRPFSLIVQVAADPDFKQIAYTQTGIKPAAEGLNRVVLPSRLQPGRTYYWRTKADDGANASEWSEPVRFEILRPIVLGVPEPLSPIGGARVTSQTPQLRVRNGQSSGPHGPLHYHFQASLTPTFTTGVAEATVAEGPGETVIVVPGTPAPDVLVYWRARVTDGTNIGQWSRTESYRTPAAAAPAPPPGGGGGGTPPPTGGGGSCASNNGDAIVRCIEAKYPSYLRAGVSLAQREANMAFLRDRVIEAGLCGGLDLAWNLKRGVGPHSIDAIAWRHPNGHVDVVDIGVGFDDTSRPLRLQWVIVAGPPGYDPYPKPSCN